MTKIKKVFYCWECEKVMGPLSDYPTGGDWFMVKDELWTEIAKENSKNVICKNCFENLFKKAKERELTKDDLKPCPMNYPVVVGWAFEGRISKEEARGIIDRMFNEKIATSQFPKYAKALYEEALSWLKEI
jgi:hypothetical protein